MGLRAQFQDCNTQACPQCKLKKLLLSYFLCSNLLITIQLPLGDLGEAGLSAAEPVREDTDKEIDSVRMETLVLDHQWMAKLAIA